MKTKKLLLTTVLAVALIFTVCPSYASTVYIDGLQSTYLPGETFSFDIKIGDIGGLVNLDTWSLGVELTPTPGARFAGVSDQNAPNYVFPPINSDFQAFSFSSSAIAVTDLWDDRPDPFNDNIPQDPYRPTDVVDKLLCTLTVNLDDASAGDVYNIGLFDTGWTMFMDFPDSNWDPVNEKYIAFVQNTEDPVFDQAYSFQVVPIPGAVWLLGSGLIGLLGLRRRRR